MTRERQYPSNSTAAVQRPSRRFNRRLVDVESDFSPVNIQSNVPQNIRTISGRIRNVSPAGLFAELDSKYDPETRFQVRVPINNKLYTLYAIVWRVDSSRSEEEPPVFGHGMKITTASDDTLNALIDFVNDAADRAEMTAGA